MKYKIKNSDIFLNGKLILEGTKTELTKDQTKGIEDFLILLSEEGQSGIASLDAQTDHPEPTEGSPELVSGTKGSLIKVTQTKTKGNKK